MSFIYLFFYLLVDWLVHLLLSRTAQVTGKGEIWLKFSGKVISRGQSDLGGDLAGCWTGCLDSLDTEHGAATWRMQNNYVSSFFSICIVLSEGSKSHE